MAAAVDPSSTDAAFSRERARLRPTRRGISNKRARSRQAIAAPGRDEGRRHGAVVIRRQFESTIALKS
jgi:hypothetical protein